MNVVWCLACGTALVLLLIRNPSAILPAFNAAATDGLQLAVSLCAAYCVWLGILNLADRAGLVKKFGEILHPLTKRLFGVYAPETEQALCLNIAANLLGVGNAATPTAIVAMRGMQDGTSSATRGMVMLFVVNAGGIQILPTTVLSLRTAAGSSNAASILLPSLLTTVCGTLLGVGLVTLLYRKRQGG